MERVKTFAVIVLALLALVEVGRWQTRQAVVEKRQLFYENGNLDVEWSVESEGREHGEMIRYYPNGQVREILQMNHGQLFSRSPEYDQDGKIITPR